MLDRKYTINLTMNIFALIVAMLQFIPNISDQIKRVFLFIMIGLLLIFFIINLCLKKGVRRNRMISKGLFVLENTKTRAVLFGGDLSWTEDYIRTITEIKDNGKAVEIYFPMNKIKETNQNARRIIQDRIAQLKACEAKVFYYEMDAGLRCIITDPDNLEDMKLLVVKRLRNIHASPNKNRYHVKVYKWDNAVEREICIPYLSCYNLINNGKYEFVLR
jgi:hypothetical protein